MLIHILKAIFLGSNPTLLYDIMGKNDLILPICFLS